MNILLVDSDGEVRSEVAQALRRSGLHVLPIGDSHFAFLTGEGSRCATSITAVLTFGW